MAPGDRTARGLASMSDEPTVVEYAPPPEHACDVLNFPMLVEDAPDLLEIHICQWVYKHRIVHFAFMLNWIAPSGDTREINRIDTSDGTVHQHFFDQQGEEVRRRTLQEIVVDGFEWSTIESQYEPCLDKMLRHALEYHRRWKQ